jgi:dTDP-4-amino-4,6-dideoxygalactose transaminase
MGIYSFNGNKIITTSGGGMLVSNRKEWIERARFLATQARDPAPHYEHTHIGFNYRLSNLLAAVGRGQLRVLDQRVERRRAINAAYRKLLEGVPGIEFMPEAASGRANNWLTCIALDHATAGASREDIRRHLERLDIESRPLWKPMHLQPAFRTCRVRGGATSADLFERGLCLPSGSSLLDEQVAGIAAEIRRICAASA